VNISRGHIKTVLEKIDRLRAELATRTAERDDARREVCEMFEKTLPACSGMTARDYAAECGWGCFDASHANTTDVPVQDGGEP
jgi:hypothetical protein